MWRLPQLSLQSDSMPWRGDIVRGAEVRISNATPLFYQCLHVSRSFEGCMHEAKVPSSLSSRRAQIFSWQERRAEFVQPKLQRALDTSTRPQKVVPNSSK